MGFERTYASGENMSQGEMGRFFASFAKQAPLPASVKKASMNHNAGRALVQSSTPALEPLGSQSQS
jgi:hypothetical protein